MFKKLKEKIGIWSKNLSKSKEGNFENQIEIEEKVTKTEKKPEKPIEKKSKAKEKQEESKEKITNIEIPQKFDVAHQKVEPNLDKIKEIGESLIEEKPKSNFFSKITSKINKIKISEEDFENYSEDLQMLLLENNVAYEVAEKIIEDLKENLVGKEILKKELEYEISTSLRDSIKKILVEPFDIIENIKKKDEKPYVVLFCGINGTGKTTTIAKMADLLKKNKITSVMAAGDTFRAASIEQIKKHGEKLNIPVIAYEYGTDPASVGFDAIKYAKKQRIDVVLIDTAGRMHNAKNLLKELEKISRVTSPDTKIFVGESIAGNDSVEQVKAFDQSIGIDGIILAKADIDEKGGTALSVGHTTGKPILFLGTGQEYQDLQKFDKNKFLQSLGFE